MRLVTYSLTVSLDGFIKGPDGGFGWGTPDPEVFRFATDEVRALSVHVMGRELYETMTYWDTIDPASLDDDETVFAELWNPLPKVVFSRTLTSVDDASVRLATGDLASEIARLRAEPGEGNIGIGGADLAHQAATLGLIDEYRIRVCPVLVGGGTPYFARNEKQVGLELVETRVFDVSGIVFLRYRTVRA